jgi:hypothetical protein
MVPFSFGNGSDQPPVLVGLAAHLDSILASRLPRIECGLSGMRWTLANMERPLTSMRGTLPETWETLTAIERTLSPIYEPWRRSSERCQ